MVYRGKPSAGCENCRKAKKRCGLEQPACHRCVKLGKTCSGYRDTTSLQIQDETKSVKQKALRQQGKPQWRTAPTPPAATGLPSPESTESDSSTPSDTTIELDFSDADEPVFLPGDTVFGGQDMGAANLLFRALAPKPDDVATTYFFNQFTSNNHWQFLRGLDFGNMDRCLEFAIKACGMAALDNVKPIGMGQEYARSMYAEALSLVNSQLRDPKRCRTNATLIAVSMLGYYENLTCEGRESIQSWKQHIRGATQLLKIRGKAQLKSPIGRVMFREIRAQIMISCLWDDLEPPAFLWDYQPTLEANTDVDNIANPVDELTALILDFAVLRAHMRQKKMTNIEAAQKASEIERRFIQWESETPEKDERWRYYEIDVADSLHVWDGKVHAYNSHPAPTAWNTFRCMRIMLSRTQEWICRQLDFSDEEREQQMLYFRRIRRQLTDQICYTIPVQLGHSSPAYTSPCVLITAYGSIWPLFFAGTCAFERIGAASWSVLNGEAHFSQSSGAAAQALWLLTRLDYISKNIGLKWADGISATLRGDFHVYENILSDINDSSEMKELVRAKAPWVKEIESTGGVAGPFAPKNADLVNALANETPEQAKKRGPVWYGKAAVRDENFRLTKIRPAFVYSDRDDYNETHGYRVDA